MGELKDKLKTAWTNFKWKSSLLSLIIGTVIGFLLCTGSANRYEIISSRQIVKLDKLTGDAWVLSGTTWKKIRHDEE
jgi:hypothetical protein